MNRRVNPKNPAILLAAAAALPLLLLAPLAGCGGGTTALGGNNGPTLPNQTLDMNGGGRATGAAPGVTAAAGTSKRAGLFVTGGAPIGYEHAWVTLNKVEVVDSAQMPTTIWESRDGLALDLATLHDNAGPLYALVTSAAVPSGRTQSRVRVTVGNSLLLYGPGETVAKTVPLSDSLPRDGEGKPVLSYSLSKARDLGTGKEDVVIAFDPTKIVLNDGRVKLVASDAGKPARAALSAGSSRQIPALFTGSVEDASGAANAPAGAEAAAAGRGEKPGLAGAVEAAAAAASPAPSPATSPLAASPVPSPVAAASSPAAPSPALAASAPSGKRGKPSPSASAALPDVPTFALRGPDGQSLIVQLGKSVAIAGDGAAGSSGLPPAGRRVQVRGTLAPDTKRIVASEIVLLPGETVPAVAAAADGAAAPDPAAAPAGDDAVVVGIASAAKDGGFTVAARQVYGLTPSQSAVNVALGKNVLLLGADGKPLAAADLAAALKKPELLVEVAGAWDPVTATLTASRVTLAPAAVPAAASPAAGKGTPPRAGGAAQ